MGETVCDAGPLIHLDELGSLDLMEGFAPLLISETVWREATRHRAGLSLEAVPGAVLTPDPQSYDPAMLALFRSFDLDAGERTALGLMAKRRASLLLCDDSAARLAAETLGWTVRGTIGVLVRAIRRGTRTAAQVRALLSALPERSSLHLSPALLQRVIAHLPTA